MRHKQIRRARPTRQTAAEYSHTGEWHTGEEHYFSGPERKAKIDGIERELQSLTRTHFPRTGILEYAVLKAHLIVEHAITQYIRCFSHVYVEPENVQFTFSQKVRVAYLLGLGINDPLTLPVIDALNSCRNQAAHKFQLDRSAIDQLLRMNVEQPDTFRMATDRERIRVLRAATHWLCTNIAANISGSYWFAEYKAQLSVPPDVPAAASRRQRCK